MLDGDHLLSVVALSFIHLSKAAFSDLFDDLVILEYLFPGGTKTEFVHGLDLLRFLKKKDLLGGVPLREQA